MTYATVVIAGGLLVAVSVASCDDRHAGTPPPVQVTITVAPETTATLENTNVRFTATVTGTTDTGVAWSVVEGEPGGAIADDGLYTAPAAHGTFHIRATGHANAAATATAAVEVTNVFPITDALIGPTAVHGSASNDVWVVEHGRHHHWDGSTWTRSEVPSASGQALVLLEAVWAHSLKEVWEAGTADLGPEIRHWDGTRWTAFRPPTGGYLFGLWGTGPSNVWALGATLVPTAHHWDGTTMSGGSLDATIGRAFSLQAAWGSSPDDVWAVGLGDESGGTSRGAAVFRWNGSTWTQFRSGLTGAPLDIWGSTANDIWISGEQGFLAHWDGQAWMPVPSGATDDLWSVWGSAANDVWAVGDGAVILHFDGNTWSPVPSPVDTDFRGVWASAPNDVWLAGQTAIIHLP